MSEPLLLIPARYGSSRFPGKPLSIINGQTLINKVYSTCRLVSDKAAVVTDDDRIENHIKDSKGKVLRVDDTVSSGTERIYLAIKRYSLENSSDLVLNVQGDMYGLRPEIVKDLINFHSSCKHFDITTLVVKCNVSDNSSNVNKVKVIYNPRSNRCHYFSRANIPYNPIDYYFTHVGIYSYTMSAIEKFCNLAESYYERCEQLEQIRALEGGLTIGAIETTGDVASVDVPEDIDRLTE